MASTQELLTAVTNMQPNAQEALPVIPNNGNPQGAYNMSSKVTPAGPPRRRGPDLSFLQPSQSMLDFTAGLQRRQQDLDSQRMQRGNVPTKPMQLPTDTIQTKPMQVDQPIMPQRGFQDMDRMRASGGLVLPQRVM